MSGCGIILYTKKHGSLKYLGLEPSMKFQKQNKGKWDLPKGTKEISESDIDCAIRETYEETGILISPKNLSQDFLEIGKLKMFYAETLEDPKLLPNPHSGIQEHTSWKWLSNKELHSNCFIWLKPFVSWMSKKSL